MSQPPRIFVGDLSRGRDVRNFGEATSDAVRKAFSRFGNITKITSGNKDFCFIDYEEIESCHEAIKNMSGAPLEEGAGGSLRVTMADSSRQKSGGYRRGDPGGRGDAWSRSDGPRRDDRERDYGGRMRSRSPPGRGGPGGYPSDGRIRERDGYARPRSRSPPRFDQRGGDPLPPPSGMPPRARSREREIQDRMIDSRSPRGAGGFSNDMMPRGDDRRRDIDPRRDMRPNPDDDRLHGRVDYGAPRSIDTGDGRYGERPGQGAGAYGRDVKEYDSRRQEPGYLPARDHLREESDYGRRAPIDGRQDPYYRPEMLPIQDGGRGGGGFRGDPANDRGGGGGSGMSRRDGGYARDYLADPPPRDRQGPRDGRPPETAGRRDRSSSRERAARAGYRPPDRPPMIYEDRGTSRALPRDADRDMPRREPGRGGDYPRDADRDMPRREPGRGGDYAGYQHPEGGRGGGYGYDYPPKAQGDHPRSDGGRAPEAYRDDNRPHDMRGHSDGRVDYSGPGRMESRPHMHDGEYRSKPNAYPQSRADEWSRGGGDSRAFQQTHDRRMDDRLGSPPRDTGAPGQYHGAYGGPQGASDGHDMREVSGVRDLNQLPPTDLRRSLVGVRDPSNVSAAGGWSGSQAVGGAPAEGMPHNSAEGGVDEKGEKISDVEAQRRRQRAERFSNPPVAQDGVMSPGRGGHGQRDMEGGMQGENDDDEGNM